MDQHELVTVEPLMIVYKVDHAAKSITPPGGSAVCGTGMALKIAERVAAHGTARRKEATPSFAEEKAAKNFCFLETEAAEPPRRKSAKVFWLVFFEKSNCLFAAPLSLRGRCAGLSDLAVIRYCPADG